MQNLFSPVSPFQSHPLLFLRTGLVPFRANPPFLRSSIVTICLLFALCLHHTSTFAQTSNEPRIIVNDPRLMQAQGADLAMDLSEERLLGESIAKQLYKDSDYLEDVVIQSYMQDIVDALLQSATQGQLLSKDVEQRMLWQTFVLKDPSINAFATPGGVLGIHLGLLGQSRTEDEVASVMAHELAHVFQRHIARSMAAEKRRVPLLIASMILGAAAAAQNPEVASAVLTTGQGLMAQGMLNFSRSMEREADRIGFAVLVQSGFHPQAFKSFFEKMQSASRLNDDGQFPYLRTHPITQERIAEMHDLLHSHNNAAPDTPLRSTSPSPSASDAEIAHSIIAVRAQILSGTVSSNVSSPPKQSRRASREHESSPASVYHSAYLAMKDRRFDRAIQEVSKLETMLSGQDRAARLARLLRWEILNTAQKPLDAQQWAAFETKASNDVAWLVLASQARGAPVSSQQALLQGLQLRVLKRPRDSSAWGALAQLYEKSQLELRSYEARAEREAARFDYEAAVGLLLAARDAESRTPESAQKHTQASINDSKRKRFEALRDAQRRYEKDSQ